MPTLRLTRRPKYGNRKVKLDGYTFDSQKEADRYVQLRMLEKAGKIQCLEPHTKMPLCAWSPDISLEKLPTRLGFYVADFTYCTHMETAGHAAGTCVVEDVKSPPTRKLAMYRWKKKHVEAQYGVTILEL